jgi:endonuclease/exonuclease/phosphatase family metal-dependent hydrolase
MIRIILIILSVPVAAAILLVGVLTLAEYRPAEREPVALGGAGTRIPGAGDSLNVLAWNIGYASLDHSQDFFMDGGKGVRPGSDRFVRENLRGIGEFLSAGDWDMVLLQEVDVRSRRSYYVDQAARLAGDYPGSRAFAYNYRCVFVPFPIPFIGPVASGLLTLSALSPREAERIQLSVPFKWPVRTAQLKRCLLVERIPLRDSDKELVLVNLHLEAYDDGAGKETQTRQLVDFLKAEYAKGNYCIAGGDFNQTFPGIDRELFPILNDQFFVPGTLSPSLLDPGWSFGMDPGTPTARLLNGPYRGRDGEDQLYIIDGFILSPNVALNSVKTTDMGFRYSDHHPVGINVTLK